MVLLKNGDEKELSFFTAVSARLSTYHGTSLPSSRNNSQANKILSSVGAIAISFVKKNINFLICKMSNFVQTSDEFDKLGLFDIFALFVIYLAILLMD